MLAPDSTPADCAPDIMTLGILAALHDEVDGLIAAMRHEDARATRITIGMRDYYRGTLHLPDFLTPVQMHLASETLAGAHAISATLAHDQASEVMGNAIQAFVAGTQLMAWATFSLAVLAIVIARRTLKAQEAASV